MNTYAAFALGWIACALVFWIGGFVSEMGWLMVWGTTLLFIDSIALILVYEKLGRVLREWPIFRMFIASSLILTFVGWVVL
jgi:hypothetical protein